MLTREPFDHSRVARRVSDESLKYPLRVSAPEDTNLAKLRWAKISGGSQEPFTDALRLFEAPARPPRCEVCRPMGRNACRD
jgi:hypothetical protein